MGGCQSTHASTQISLLDINDFRGDQMEVTVTYGGKEIHLVTKDSVTLFFMKTQINTQLPRLHSEEMLLSARGKLIRGNNRSLKGLGIGPGAQLLLEHSPMEELEDPAPMAGTHGWTRIWAQKDGQHGEYEYPIPMIQLLARSAERVRIQHGTREEYYVESRPGSEPIKQLRAGMCIGSDGSHDAEKIESLWTGNCDLLRRLW